MAEPNLIYQLCENNVDIDKWISENTAGLDGGHGGLDLMRHFTDVDFRRRIFRIGNG